jgi:hypothetical protein
MKLTVTSHAISQQAGNSDPRHIETDLAAGARRLSQKAADLGVAMLLIDDRLRS